jgi:hypothetical protein
VYEAIKALEAATVLSSVNRLVRVQCRELDLFGKMALRSRLVRTSNAYVFRDPLPCAQGRGAGRGGETAGAVSWASSTKSENPPGTLNQDFYSLSQTPPDPKDGLEQALIRLKSAMMVKKTSMTR